MKTAGIRELNNRNGEGHERVLGWVARQAHTSKAQALGIISVWVSTERVRGLGIREGYK